MLRLSLLCLPVLLTAAIAEENGDTFLFRRRAFVQHHCQPVYHQPVYHQPVYHQPVYHEPIVQKIISYDYQTLVTPVYTQVQPLIAAAPVYYWSVTEAYQQKAMWRELLREELRNSGIGQQPQPQPLQRLQQPAERPAGLPQNMTVRPEAVSWVVDDVTPPELQKENLVAFQTGCVRCHGATGKVEGGLKLVLPQADGSLALTKLSGDKRWKIYAMASAGAMPPEAATDAAKAMNSKFLPALLKRAALRD